MKRLSILFCAMMSLLPFATATAAVTFKQGTFVETTTTVASVAKAYASAQTAGDLNVVVVAWRDATATIAAVTDTKGNAYTLAVGPTVSATHGTQAIYYAKNIVAATAGSNTVTVTFTTAAAKPDLRIAEYSGIQTTSPLDKTAAAVGTTGTAASSGAVATTYPNDLIIGADIAGSTTSAVGTGYTQRVLTTTNKDLLEDKTVTVAGSNSATATLTASNWWIIQLAAFKATDTTAPTAPGSLTTTVASATQINLSWAASTDAIGVTGYLVERCSGASCTVFTQIASVTSGTTYSDTGLAPSTSYSYRVRATDAAGNFSGYSATSTKATSADTTAPSAPAGLTASAASTSQINLAWTAATDNVAVTGYTVERCAGAGCTTFAQVATPAGTSYSDTALLAGTSYSYRVRANDAAGNLSAYSNTATAVTNSVDTQAPTAPASLAAVAAGGSQINISWPPSSDNVGVTGYFLERCSGVGCSTFVQIATPTTTSYSDSGLTTATSYSYRVRAGDAAGNLGAYSPTASATTADTVAPTAPATLNATGGSGNVQLSWAASTDNVGVANYSIERCSGVGCVSFAALAGTAATSYSDSAVTAATSYTYQVRAFDAAGNASAYSPTATAVPTALSATYTYDATGHLKTVTTTDGKTVTYSYDAAGNLSGVSSTP